MIFSASLRRKMLDRLLNSQSSVFFDNAVVLDIGGRDRGEFKKPKNKVKKWIFADIEPKHNPDIILDVSDMKEIKSDSIDIILASELFEHVEKPEIGLSECFRVLKDKGIMILSIPFLYRIHGDPFDFQRWTDKKWIKELENVGFKIEEFIIMGRYFSVMADNFKFFAQTLWRFLRYPIYLILFFVDAISWRLDKTKFIENNHILSSFHGGYFIKIRK